jgi:hypothetical protein
MKKKQVNFIFLKKLYYVQGKMMIMVMLASVFTTDNNMLFNSVFELFTCWLNKVMAQLQQSQHEYEKNKQGQGTKGAI